MNSSELLDQLETQIQGDQKVEALATVAELRAQLSGTPTAFGGPMDPPPLVPDGKKN